VHREITPAHREITPAQRGEGANRRLDRCSVSAFTREGVAVLSRMAICEPAASRARVALTGLFAHQTVRAGGKAFELDCGGSILGQQAGEDACENDGERFHNFSHCMIFSIA
jgi:hypothetical protein